MHCRGKNKFIFDFKTPFSTPREPLYMETGIVDIEHQAKKKQLMMKCTIKDTASTRMKTTINADTKAGWKARIENLEKDISLSNDNYNKSKHTLNIQEKYWRREICEGLSWKLEKTWFLATFHQENMGKFLKPSSPLFMDRWAPNLVGRWRRVAKMGLGHWNFETRNRCHGNLEMRTLRSNLAMKQWDFGVRAPENLN